MKNRRLARLFIRRKPIMTQAMMIKLLQGRRMIRKSFRIAYISNTLDTCNTDSCL